MPNLSSNQRTVLYLAAAILAALAYGAIDGAMGPPNPLVGVLAFVAAIGCLVLAMSPRRQN